MDNNNNNSDLQFQNFSNNNNNNNEYTLGDPQPNNEYTLGDSQPDWLNQNNQWNPSGYQPSDTNLANIEQEPQFVIPQPPRHPIAVLFHYFFRTTSFVLYLLPFWDNNFIVMFILTILFQSADFWTVKNVTGRLLVGLRWWNCIKDDGSNEWIFQSLEGERAINQGESVLFWLALLGFPVAWAIFGIIAIFGLSISSLLVVGFCMTLCCVNVIGFYKCAKDAKSKMRVAAASAAQTVASAAF
eukprot:TRINITY_DN1322_c0_g1_i1.p1 TRINITY_DN1322_c0_g1~~TRINITY_DN1322_c0_g1_i1.p1  ORF type:complete len:242 (+),score=113.47 TRINITY_DN1322_c0_g1_i1:112-837(+)